MVVKVSGDLIISGDCGGTNTRLSLWSVPHGSEYFKGNIAPGEIIFTKKYHNENYATFVQVCLIFLKEAQVAEAPVACVLACAGPILNNSVVFTNIPFGWEIDGVLLEHELGIQNVKLINDFAAMGYGLLTLKPHEYLTLNDVPSEDDAPIATIGAGTGLGECFLTPAGDTYNCYACEGGHCDYAPINELEVELYNVLRKRFACAKRLSVERIVSGPGLAAIYEFLAEKFPEKVDGKIHAEFLEAGTLQGAVVGKNATQNELCDQSMRMFVEAYGREAGNAILKYLPRGGFFLTGGLAPKNLDYFTKDTLFLDAIFDKGRVSPAVKRVPIYLVLSEDLGERGAHYYAYQLLSSLRSGKSLEAAKKEVKSLFTMNYAVLAGIAAVGVSIGLVLGKKI